MKELFKLTLLFLGIFLTADKVLAGKTADPPLQQPAKIQEQSQNPEQLQEPEEDDEFLDEADESPSAEPSTNNKKPIEISADSVEQEGSKNIVKARGNVVVRFESKTVRADQIVVNTETGVGEAWGHVLITEVGTRLKADRTSFNLKSSQGKLYNARGKVAKNFIVDAKEIVKLGEEHYQTKDATLTTCRGALPDWLIQTKTADMKVGNRALFTGGVFKVRNVPVIYLPIGYVPLNNERKSGFLTPALGNSNINGFTMNNAYYWAIDKHSDATVYIDYMKNRGVQPGLEYRYTPSKTTNGIFLGNYLSDDITKQDFYKVNWTHNQVFPQEVKVNGKLDLVSSSNSDKTFSDNTIDRTRRNTDSFLNVNKNWRNNSLSVLSRYRNSVEESNDDTFGLLPQVTFKTQRFALGNTPLYFNQDASFSVFYTDLVPTPGADDKEHFERFDFHPQASLLLHPAPWLAVTPTVGFRETYYSRGLDASRNRLPAFSRELFDAGAAFEGPKINRVFHTNSAEFPKIKHVIEPRLNYNYIPDFADDDRNRIKAFDGTDTIGGVNQIAYSLTQRLLQKKVVNEDTSETNEILKLDLSQVYNIREATRDTPPGVTPVPFSILQADFISRPMESLMVNFRTGYDPREELIKTFNFEVGVKPVKGLMFLFERRYTRDFSTFDMGTVDLTLPKGWRLQYSARYDELLKKFQENDVSLKFDDLCRCWGMSFDFIKRNIINNGIEQGETKFMFRLTLRGLGTIGTKNQERLIHRYF
ncbi:MAG: LPS-assembly protein LptD [Nitrospinae bacterium]|nr:LPS-assembly protein LptD [Nitrospinota bacterium]